MPPLDGPLGVFESSRPRTSTSRFTYLCPTVLAGQVLDGVETLDAIDLGGPLAERGLSFAVENDASAAALGEWYFGARHDSLAAE
ncbi:MAG: hypothetical protein V5A44_06045 [Haloarculaceae archaeon]